METEKEYEILNTNLDWKKVKNVIRQIQEFLFGYNEAIQSTFTGSSPRVQILEDQIQTLQKSYPIQLATLDSEGKKSKCRPRGIPWKENICQKMITKLNYKHNTNQIGSQRRLKYILRHF